MTLEELLHKIKRIEIKAHRLSENVFSGEYHSAFKGRGMAFAEVREYLYGDDVRDIDWNVTARYRHPYVKVYQEERELSVMLIVDVSASNSLGAIGSIKRDRIAEISATLAFSAMHNNDMVGLLFISDRVEKFIPPKKGKKHILLIIRELLTFNAQSRRTDLAVGIEFLAKVIKKRCTAFILSDFIDCGDVSQSISLANKRHELVAIRVFDERDTELPDVGLVQFLDSETGKTLWVDTSNKRVNLMYNQLNNEEFEYLVSTTRKANIALTSISTNQDYVIALLKVFKHKHGTKRLQQHTT